MYFSTGNLCLVRGSAARLNGIESFLRQTAIAKGTDNYLAGAIVDPEGELIGDVDADFFESVLCCGTLVVCQKDSADLGLGM